MEEIEGVKTEPFCSLLILNKFAQNGKDIKYTLVFCKMICMY